MSRLTEKLSSLIALQLPEHIRSDHSTFVSFLEAYYRYIEQDEHAQEIIQNAKSYDDIDHTINSFIQYFLKQYCKDIPIDILVDKKLLVKYINDIYNSKGTERAYKLLFRMIFNKVVDIFYPSTQILIASDGKWRQRNSIFIQTVFGDIGSIVGKTVSINNESYNYPIKVDSQRQVFDATGNSDNTFELFIKNSINAPITVGDNIEFGTYKGVVVSIPANVTISRPGAGFRVGSVLNLKSGEGTSLKVKITRVTPTGGIRTIQIISFGIGYPSDFFNFFTADSPDPISTDFNFEDGEITLLDKTSGFVDEGTIYTSNYTSDIYFADDYVGNVLRTFYTNTTTNPDEDVSTGSIEDAILFVSLGSTAKYPGYYENNDGFLSDTIYLQDAHYYQPFSYVLKVDELLQSYKNMVLDILHPAGTKLFGELQLTNTINIQSEVMVMFNYMISRFLDIINITDNTSIYSEKGFDELVDIDDSVGILVNKFPEEGIEIEDVLTRLLGRGLLDEVETTEDISKNIFLDPAGVGVFTTGYDDGNSAYALDYFAEDYVSDENSFAPIDLVNINIDKNLVEEMNIGDYGTIDVSTGDVYAFQPPDNTEPYFAENYTEGGFQVIF